MLHKLIAWLLTALWMGLIFYFSHQPGDASSSLSSGISENIVAALNMLPLVQLDIESIHTLLRKSAHFFVYLILGILVLHALRRSEVTGYKSIMYAMIICVFYAITDEVHQLFIPGRSGEVRDVLIDSAGAGTGVALYMCIMYFSKRKHKKKW